MAEPGTLLCPCTHVPAHGPDDQQPGHLSPGNRVFCIVAFCVSICLERAGIAPGPGEKDRWSCRPVARNPEGVVPRRKLAWGLHPTSCRFGLRHLTGSCLGLSCVVRPKDCRAGGGWSPGSGPFLVNKGGLSQHSERLRTAAAACAPRPRGCDAC